jgi:hypothetical protein
MVDQKSDQKATKNRPKTEPSLFVTFACHIWSLIPIPVDGIKVKVKSDQKRFKPYWYMALRSKAVSKAASNAGSDAVSNLTLPSHI